MIKENLKLKTVWRFECRDAAGNLKWDLEQENQTANEGQNALLDVFYRNGTAPTQFFIRLYNDTPVKTDSLTNLTGEPSGNGYAAVTIERSAVGWPTLALDSGDYQITSKNAVFTASGGAIGPVTYAVLATTSDNTGLLISYVALSVSRTLQDGDTLTVTLSTKLT